VTRPGERRRALPGACPAGDGQPVRNPVHRFVLADVSAATRLLLRASLEQAGGFEVVGEAADGTSAILVTQRLTPDVLVLDLSLPGIDGFAVLSELRLRAPSVRIVVHSGLDRGLTGLGPEDGVAAYVSKDLPHDRLIERLRAVLTVGQRVEIPAQTQPVAVDLVSRLGAALRFQDELLEAPLDVDVVLSLLAAGAQSLVGADGAVIELRDGDDLVYRSTSGVLAGTDGTKVAIAGSLSGAALTTGEVLACDDVLLDPRADEATCRRLGIASMVVVPLGTTRDAGGVLKVAWVRPRAFTSTTRTCCD